MHRVVYRICICNAGAASSLSDLLRQKMKVREPTVCLRPSEELSRRSAGGLSGQRADSCRRSAVSAAESPATLQT